MIVAITNQKGGVGKTTTTANLGYGLAEKGKKVLLIDADPQASLTISLGLKEPEKLSDNIVRVIEKIINGEDFEKSYGIKKIRENLDLLPSNIELASAEVSLVTVMSREQILKQYVGMIKDEYDYVLIDCMPSLGMLTINALTCADSVLIPVQAAYLPVIGLQQLIRTIGLVKKRLNPGLELAGILFTMTQKRTRFTKDIMTDVTDLYGKKIRIFKTDIPASIKAAETSAKASSIYEHDPKGRVAEAYRKLVSEVLGNE